ncbi:MAG: hypothetical protein JO360_07715, partial [Acidobacteria bacterium]|nr:hypothetical protein [Acidobacteriota bacterium]
MKMALRLVSILSIGFLVMGCPYLFNHTFAQNKITDQSAKQVAAPQQEGKRELKVVPVRAAATAVVNVADLARRQAATPPDLTPRMIVPPNQIIIEEESSPGESAPQSSGEQTQSRPDSPQVASPNPTTSFLGHNDVVQVGSGSIVIPPDTTGAVGLTRIVTFLNNNYVVQNKTTGAQISAVSIETFFGGIGATGVF